MFGYGFQEPQDNRSFFARLLDSLTDGEYSVESGQVDWMMEQADMAVHPRRYPVQPALPPISVNLIMGAPMGTLPAPAEESRTSTLTWLAIALGVVFICFLMVVALATIPLVDAVFSPVQATPQQIDDFSFPSNNPLFCGVYGRLQGWGTLSGANSPQEAINMAKEFASTVDQWTDRQTVPMVNPVVQTAGEDVFVRQLIPLAKQQGVVVMLDIQDASLARGVIDNYLDSNVWVDLDIEWSQAGAVGINTVASYYASQRKTKGLDGQLGVVGFYIFNNDNVDPPSVTRRYEQGNVSVIPLFDGCGGTAEFKCAKTDQVLWQYSPPWGIMSFCYRFSSDDKHGDKISEEDYCKKYEDKILIFMRQ